MANWHKDRFTRGAYSYTTVESPAARRLLNKGIEQTIFFAGEGYYEGSSPGTVEAAFVVAANVAEKIAGASKA
jgi:hypothetical protein